MLAFTPTADPQEIQARRDTLSGLYARFSDTGEGYRALNKTLAHFRELIHSEPLLENLKYTHLERTITDKLELITLLRAVEVYRKEGRRLNPLWKTATRSQIEKAMKIALYDVYEQGEKTDDETKLFVERLFFYEPLVYADGFVSFAEQVKKVVEKISWERRKTTLELFGPRRKLVSPRYVPYVPGVRFIETVGGLWDESVAMGNCTIDFAKQAIDGEMFFFHVEKDGEHATTKVLFNGMFESEGKNHKPNAASRWQWWNDVPEQPKQKRRRRH